MRPSVLPTDHANRRLCHSLFDAIEAVDLDAVADCLSDDATMWFNVTGATSSRDQILAALGEGAKIQRRRTYDDRQIDTWDDGFLARYTCTVVLHNGLVTALWACLVGTVRDGKITAMHEYLDSSKFVPGKRRT